MTQNTKSLFEVKIEHSPCFNFAFQQNSIPVISRIELSNGSEEDYEDLTLQLKLSPDLAPTIERNISALPSGGTIYLEKNDFELEFERLSTWSEKLRADVQLQILGQKKGADETEKILVQSSRVDVYAWNEWTGLQTLPEILCAFITPNLAVNDTVLGDVSELLGQRTGASALDGYQSNSKERVYAMIGAIYDAVCMRKIRYAVPPASFENTGQKIRFGNGIIETNLGTCLDLSLWFAGLLEQAGLRPMILIHEGHAYIGCWLIEESFPDSAIDDLQQIRKRVEFEDIMVFEATACTIDHGINLEGAVREAGAHLKKDDVFQMCIDVNRARANGIRPLPLQESGTRIDPTVKKVQTPLARRPESGKRKFSPELVVEDKKVQATRLDRWKQHLLDLTLRNRLLNFKETKQTIPFACVDLGQLEDRLAATTIMRLEAQSTIMSDHDPRDLCRLARMNGESPIEEYLLKELSDKRLRSVLSESEMEKRLLGLYRSSRLELQESGSNTLFIALGMLEWTPIDSSDQTHLAPILLLPVRLERKSVVAGYTLIREDADPIVNVTLLELLRRDFSISVPGLDPLPEDESGIDVDRILKLFAQAVLEYKGWEVHMEVWLGRFSFNKFLLWKDLQERLDHLTQNPVVDHLVNKPGEPFNDGIETPSAKEMDEVIKLTELFTPLSADSSQLAAVLASEQGKNFVLFGPPGTGKSQTIANLITHNIAKGRTVLFVAEKRAALEVVHNRLAKLGLAEFCLELHSNKAGKRDILGQFGEVMDLSTLQSPEEWEYAANQLEAVRKELNQRVRELHRPGPAGLTPYQCYSYLIFHSNEIEHLSLMPILNFSNIADHTREELDRMRYNLNEMQLQLKRVEAEDRLKLKHFQFLDWTPAWEQEAIKSAQELIDSVQVLKIQYEKLGDLLGLTALPDDNSGVTQTIQFSIHLTEGKAVPREFILTGGWSEFCKEMKSSWLPTLKTYQNSMEALGHFDLTKLEALNFKEIESKFSQVEKGNGIISQMRQKLLIRPVKKCLLDKKKTVNWRKDFLVPYACMSESRSSLIQVEENIVERLGKNWKGLASNPEEIEKLLSFGDSIHKGILQLAGADPERLLKLKARIADFLEQFDELLSEGQSAYQVISTTVGKWNHFSKAFKNFASLLELNQKDPFPGKDFFEQRLLLGQACLDGQKGLRFWGAWQRGRSMGAQQGLQPLIAEMECGQLQPEDAGMCFEIAYRTAVVSHALNNSEVLRNFFGDEQEQQIRRFCQLDEDYIRKCPNNC
ncbi:DUF4011 domain-containing protein [Kiritimatiellaeota bacterium B1221]|nr:DUF4011 domain-containing protein [Kiritimatiellaeota bacterium B1221]